MKIEKLPSGSYRVQKMINGKRHSFTFEHKPTKKEIDQMIAEKMTSSETALNVPNQTFKSCAEKYLSIRKNVVSPSTIRGYDSIIRNLSDWFLNLSVKNITQLEVQKEINDYSATRSPKSTRNAHGFISAVLGMFKPDLVLKTTLPQKEKKEGYIPTSDEISAILSEVENTRYYIPFKLGTYGMRRSEICALKYPDDFDGNYITINKALVQDTNNEWIVKVTKTTESTREIYIDDDLLNRIKESGIVYNGYPTRLYHKLTDIQNKLGIQNFRFHDLRHYFATELSQSGQVSEEDILKLGGWSTPYTMKRVYRHARIQNDKTAQKNASEIIAHKLHTKN